MTPAHHASELAYTAPIAYLFRALDPGSCGSGR
jgi:hypothetical protein